MRNAKGIVHISIKWGASSAIDQVLNELRRVLCFTWIKAEILYELDTRS
jgi:hypothetical protein